MPKLVLGDAPAPSASMRSLSFSSRRNSGDASARLDLFADQPLPDSGDEPLTLKRRYVMDRVGSQRSAGRSNGDDEEESMVSFYDAGEGAERDPPAASGHSSGGLFELFRFPGSGSSKQRPFERRGTVTIDEEDHLEQFQAQALRQLNDEFGDVSVINRVRGLAAGEEVFLANKRATKSAASAAIASRTVMGKKISPLAKNREKLQAEMEAEKVLHAKVEAEAEMALRSPARSLKEWFEAGLKLQKGLTDEVRKSTGSRRVSTSLGLAIEGRRPPPPGFEVALWASAAIPLLRHDSTGVVVWPIRYNLVSLFDFVENRGDQGREYRSMTTVYHYTSAGGFERIVAPPSAKYSSEWELAEELWDRLEDDFSRHNIPDVAGAPEYCLAFLSGDPSSFNNRGEIARAVYKTESKHLGPGSAGHCIAFNVPMDHCVAATEDEALRNTCIVLAPGEGAADESEVSEGGHVLHKGNKRKNGRRFVAWGQRNLLSKKGEKVEGAQQVQRLGLLDGLVDRESGKVVLSHGRHEGSKASLRKAMHPVGEVVEEEEQEEEAARTQLVTLTEERSRLEKKLKQAQKHHDKQKAGEPCNLLFADPHRLAKLRRLFDAVNAKTEALAKELALLAEQELQSSPRNIISPRSRRQEAVNARRSRAAAAAAEAGAAAAAASSAAGSSVAASSSLRTSSVELGEDAARAEEDPAAANVDEAPHEATTLAAKKRRRKIIALHSQSKNATEFAPEVQEAINDIGHEYADMHGEIFREVFGGNLPGVRKWLDDGGDPNFYHDATGWTPVLMATSQGDPAMLSLLLEYNADLSLASADHGWSAVHIAVRKNTTELLSMVVEGNPMCVNEKSKDGTTALLGAVDVGAPRVRDDMVRLLLEASSEPNAPRRDGWTPLGIAVARNFRNATKLLIQHRGNIFDECPDTTPRITIWQAAARHPGLQAMIKDKLNSRDLHLIERRWPGLLNKLDKKSH